MATSWLGKYFKTSEVILTAIMTLLNGAIALINSNKLTSEYDKLRKIRAQLTKTKKSIDNSEKIEQINKMIAKIDKITKSGFKSVKEESVNLEELVNESYEQMIVFEENVHNLFMDLAKSEHNAIVNEDTVLLKEAEEDFKTKLTNFLKTAWNEFVNFINKAIATISSLQVKIQSMFLKKEKVEKIKKFVEHNRDASASTFFTATLKKFSIESRQLDRIGDWKELDEGINKIASLTDRSLVGHIDELNNVINDLKKFRGVTMEVNSKYGLNYDMFGLGRATGLLEDCYNVFEKRKSWIDTLKRLKNNGLKQYKEDLKNIQDGKLKSQDKLNVSNIRRAVNSIVFSINYMTIDAIKIMNAFDKTYEHESYSNKSNNNSYSNTDYESEKKQKFEATKAKEPSEPEIDKSDSSKWTDNGVRIYKNGEYVNLSPDEKEWLEYIREMAKSEYTNNREKAKIRQKAINKGYTNESYLGF